MHCIPLEFNPFSKVMVALASTFLEAVSSILQFCSIRKKYDLLVVLNLLSMISPVCHLLEKVSESSLPSFHKPPFYIIQSPSLSHPDVVTFVFFKQKSPSVDSHALNRNHSLCFIILFYLYLLSDLGNQSFVLDVAIPLIYTKIS